MGPVDENPPVTEGEPRPSTPGAYGVPTVVWFLAFPAAPSALAGPMNSTSKVRGCSEATSRQPCFSQVVPFVRVLTKGTWRSTSPGHWPCRKPTLASRGREERRGMVVEDSLRCCVQGAVRPYPQAGGETQFSFVNNMML